MASSLHVAGALPTFGLRREFLWANLQEDIGEGTGQAVEEPRALMTGSVGGKDGFFIADGDADKPGSILLVHLNNQRDPKGNFQTGAQQG